MFDCHLSQHHRVCSVSCESVRSKAVELKTRTDEDDDMNPDERSCEWWSDCFPEVLM